MGGGHSAPSAPSASSERVERETRETRARDVAEVDAAATEVDAATTGLEAMRVETEETSTPNANADAIPAMNVATEATTPSADPTEERFSVTTAINYANGAPHMGTRV